MRRSLPIALALAWICASSSAGCSTARGQVALAPIPLNMPLPPERVVVAKTLEPEPPPTPVTPPPATSNPSPPQTRSRPPASNTRLGEKPDPAPPAVVIPDLPAPALQTMANVEEIEQATQQRLTDAQKALDSVNYKELGAEAKEHYDRAQGFVNQARIALKIKNYVYAEQLSKNAATLASALRKR